MSYIVKSVRYELIKGKVKRNNPFYFEHVIKSEKPSIFLFFVACGTNMGDHAIVRAEKEYLTRVLGKSVHIIEIQTGQTENAINVVKKNIRQRDIIILSGGGYVGDEYIEVYKPLLRIIKKFRKNKIIIFPQTIFFHGIKREKKFVALCKMCTQLQIFVREKRSQEIFARYGVKTELVPDIVLSQTPIAHIDCSAILMCMRNDVEKGLTNKELETIKSVLLDYMEVVITDTVIDEVFPQEQRFDYLNKMLEKFSKSALVVTDRIHGMIFSYLTNTPCIAFGNYNHKVESEYEWLEQASNIHFLKSVDTELIRNTITNLLENPSSENHTYHDEFASLEKVIKLYYE